MSYETHMQVLRQQYDERVAKQRAEYEAEKERIWADYEQKRKSIERYAFCAYGVLFFAFIVVLAIIASHG